MAIPVTLQVRGGAVLAYVEHGVRISWGIGDWFSLGKGLAKPGASFCAVVDWRHHAQHSLSHFLIS